MAATFQSLEANLRESFRVLARGRPHADVAELDGVSIASLGASFQMFNAAFLSGPVLAADELAARLACARELFALRKLPWAFWICEDWLARPVRRNLTRACEGFGLRAVTEMPGMATDSLRPPRRFAFGRTSPRLEIRRADTSQVMEDFRMIGSLCFHVPPLWFREVFDDTIPARQFTCWVAYRQGKPVATAATLAHGGAIGLYNVATIPDERGHGYAEAVTRHAVDAASTASGLTQVILQSTALGERLYARLGFREVTRVVVFNSNANA